MAFVNQKGIIMRELVHYWKNKYSDWDGDIIDLPCEAKDEAVYQWLTEHETWFDDIYPASFSQASCRMATLMLFGENPASSEIIRSLFITCYENAPDEYGEDDCWWSEAMDDIDIDDPNLAETIKENVYLYLEDTLRTVIQEMHDREYGNEI